MAGVPRFFIRSAAVGRKRVSPFSMPPPLEVGPLTGRIEIMSGIRLVTCILFLLTVYCTSGYSQMNYILNIYDNRAPEGSPAVSDWGFSSFIEYNGRKILFDSGRRAGILKKNAETLGIDLKSVELAFLSHDHDDHVNGFDYVMQINPGFKFYLPNDHFLGGGEVMEPDAEYPRGLAYRHPNSEYVAESREIAPGMYAIATVSELVGRFWKYPPNEVVPEYDLMPELSLGLVNSDGTLTLISGCSHSTIEKIIAEAKRVSGAEVSLVIGGFHMAPYPVERVEPMARTVKDDLGVMRVAPTHCTGDDAIGVFKKLYGDDCLEYMLGSRIELK